MANLMKFYKLNFNKNIDAETWKQMKSRGQRHISQIQWNVEAMKVLMRHI